METANASVAEKEQYVIKEKQRRREDVIHQVERRKAVEETVDDLYEWIDELHAELVDAKVTAKLAKGAAKDEILKEIKIGKGDHYPITQIINSRVDTTCILGIN